jgi:ABC-type multidrug transport system permease subunit
MGVLVGLSVRDSRVANSAVFLFIFPMTFLSNAFAPTTGMPRPLQYVAEWNPVSTMVAGVRDLFGLEPMFGATANSLPSQNPLVMSMVYIALLMAIFIPLSVRKYKIVSPK